VRYWVGPLDLQAVVLWPQVVVQPLLLLGLLV
jgi:hypothetical protein